MNDNSIDDRSGIYKITSPKGKIYIGQSKNIRKRMLQYRFFDAGYKQPDRVFNKSLINKSIRKYGYNLHKFEVLIHCDISELDEHETKLINEHKTNIIDYPNNDGLNLCDGGKRSSYTTKVKSKDEISNFFKHLNTGKKYPNRKKPADKTKILKNLDRVHKMLEKPVMKYTKSGLFIDEYSSLKKAAESVNGNYQSIYRVCSFKRPTAYGFTWRYKNPVDIQNVLDTLNL